MMCSSVNLVALDGPQKRQSDLRICISLRLIEDRHGATRYADELMAALDTRAENAVCLGIDRKWSLVSRLRCAIPLLCGVRCFKLGASENAREDCPGKHQISKERRTLLAYNLNSMCARSAPDGFDVDCRARILSELFCPHLVGLVVTALAPNGQIRNYMYSGFMADIQGNWLWITAGHSLTDDIEPAIKAGYKVLQAFFVDRTADGDTSPPIIIDFDRSRRIGFYNDSIDVGILEISELTKRNLKANKIPAVTSRVCGNPHATYSGYYLIGAPEEFFALEPAGDGANLKFSPLALPLWRIPDQTFPDGTFRLQFEADPMSVKIDGEPLKSVVGMRGGLIVGCEEKAYFPLAIQSGWDKDAWILRAMPVLPVLLAIEKACGVRPNTEQ